jgi:tetratricopeptide (TPR) repeat protein
MAAKSSRIRVLSGAGSTRVVELPAEGVVRIGSAPGCQVILESPDILPVHFFLKTSGGRAAVVVRDPAAAVRINGVVARQKLLASGDKIELAEAVLIYESQELAAAAKVSSADRDPLLGSVIAGYRIEDCLGRGAMGTVYRATQLSLERTVALKILSSELTSNREFVQGFLREARAMARLNHPNVVQVYDAVQEGEFFLFSMEYLPGGTLAGLLERVGRLPVETALKLARDAAQALVWAEEQGIIHRDIKPDNLLLASDGRAKLADLGIALEQHLHASGAAGPTAAGPGSRGLGSPRYMAPEQALGRVVDRRADIYALGSTLFAMVAGRPPFEGDTPVEILRAKISSDAPPIEQLLPDLPEPVAALINRMLARDPAERHASAGELLAAIDEALARLSTQPGEPAAKGAAAEAGGRRSASRQRRAHASAAPAGSSSFLNSPAFLAAAAVVMLAFVLVFLHLQQQEPPPETVVTPAGSPTAAPGPAGSGDIAMVRQSTVAAPAGRRADEEPLFPEEEDDRGSEAGRDLQDYDPADPANVAILRELGGIVSEWRTGVALPRQALAALEGFKRKYPQPVYAERANGFIRQIQESLSNQNRSEIAKVVREKATPAIERGRFAEADSYLDALATSYSENAEEIAREKQRLDEAAATAIQREIEGVALAAERGEFALARKLLEDFIKLMPDRLRTTLEARLAVLEREEKSYGEAMKLLAAAGAGIRKAIGAADFDRAASMVASIQAADPGVAAQLEPHCARLASEVQSCRESWQLVTRALEQAIGAKSALELSFAGDAGAKSRFVVQELKATSLTLRPAAGGRADERPLLGLSSSSLLELVSGGSAPAPSTIEGLGLLLLHGQGPQRARELLLDTRLGAEKIGAYQERLRREEESFLASSMDALRERLRAMQPASGEGGARAARHSGEWLALAAEIGQVISIAMSGTQYRQVRGELAGMFLAARIESARASVPQSLFHGEVKSYKNDGSIRLVYDFASEEQMADFVPARGFFSRIEVSDRMLKIKGECRLSRGDPFRNRISIRAKVPATGYNLAAPNINIALWTRDDDQVSPNLESNTLRRRPGAPFGPPAVPESLPDDYFVFGIGYKGGLSFAGTDYGYLRGPGNTRIPMPANVLFAGQRGLQLHSYPELECLWGTGVIGKVKGPQDFQVVMSPDSVQWLINNRPVPLRSSSEINRLKRSEPYVGSITFFSNSEVVHFDSLLIDSELNPEWVQGQLLRLAEAELKKLDSTYPWVPPQPVPRQPRLPGAPSPQGVPADPDGTPAAEGGDTVPRER